MRDTRTSIIVTSIFHPTKALKDLAQGAEENNWNFVIIGDVSSPKDFYLEGASFFNMDKQRELPFKLTPLCPERHYTRKNLGYLVAMSNDSDIIVETDDDNIPVEEFWLPRKKVLEVDEIKGEGWSNVYKFFTDKKVWPRGLPLEEVLSTAESHINEQQKIFCPIQQGLADQNPDVDAVFRMTCDLPLDFNKVERPYMLDKRVWCPFNSQNTTWFKEAFPLLYLPSFCTFRMTDIWRSFVAQRVAWECGWKITFHNSTVYQERNEHDLLKDFEQEIPGYLLNNKIKKVLEELPLKSGQENISDNMLICYEGLIKENIIHDSKELILLTAWLEDVHSLMNHSHACTNSEGLAVSG